MIWALALGALLLLTGGIKIARAKSPPMANWGIALFFLGVAILLGALIVRFFK